MKKILLSITILIFCNCLNAQNILTISNEEITFSEFKTIFFKNNHDVNITKEYLDDYMNLFVNYKLKVIEAKELGMDTLSSFIAELEGYRKQLAKPYLKNNEFDSQMLVESYDRILKDVNVSHILISVDQNATEKEAENALKQAKNIRNSILENKISFTDAAKKYSDDNSAKLNGGNLGYFTAFMMVYDFETVAYNTNIGEISKPVKTKYGYHLIKVNDIRNAVGKVEVAHIMFKTGQAADQKKIDNAKNKINKVQELLLKGDDFYDVAERFSEDRSTAVKGGKLPVFGVGKMVPEFENVSFSLKKINDISNPFRTDYGWHIVKLINKFPILSFDDLESNLKEMINKDSRSQLSEDALYKKLREENSIKNRPEIYKSFRRASVNKISDGAFSVNSLDKTTLLYINNSPISVNDFSNYILNNQFNGANIDKMYNDFINKNLLLIEENNLENKFPEYKSLLKEYREGILLFDLTNIKVWKKAIEDTLGLEEFFKLNQSLYTWPTRLDATIYKCEDLSTARKVKHNIYKKNRDKITNEEILSKINDENPLKLQIISKKFTKNEIDYLSDIEWRIGISKDIILDDGTYVLVNVHDILQPSNKKLSEIRGKVISEYQKELEENWILSLRSKYSININKELLYTLIQ